MNSERVKIEPHHSGNHNYGHARGCRWHIHDNRITKCHNVPMCESTSTYSWHLMIKLLCIWDHFGDFMVYCRHHQYYCSVLYMGLPLKSIQKLQLVQNEVVQTVIRTPQSMHITILLHKVHWLPVSLWIQFKVLTVSYNGIHNIGPSYLRTDASLWGLIHSSDSFQPIRFSRWGMLWVPPIRECHL